MFWFYNAQLKTALLQSCLEFELIYGGTVVSDLESRSSGLDLSPGGVIALCSLAIRLKGQYHGGFTAFVVKIGLKI